MGAPTPLVTPEGSSLSHSSISNTLAPSWEARAQAGQQRRRAGQGSPQGWVASLLSIPASLLHPTCCWATSPGHLQAGRSHRICTELSLQLPRPAPLTQAHTCTRAHTIPFSFPSSSRLLISPGDARTTHLLNAHCLPRLLPFIKQKSLPWYLMKLCLPSENSVSLLVRTVRNPSN